MAYALVALVVLALVVQSQLVRIAPLHLAYCALHGVGFFLLSE